MRGRCFRMPMLLPEEKAFVLHILACLPSRLSVIRRALPISASPWSPSTRAGEAACAALAPPRPIGTFARRQLPRPLRCRPLPHLALPVSPPLASRVDVSFPFPARSARPVLARPPPPGLGQPALASPPRRPALPPALPVPLTGRIHESAAVKFYTFAARAERSGVGWWAGRGSGPFLIL